MSTELQAMLFQALESPLGIEVESNKPEQLRQKLYALRKTDTLFDPLAFVISPTKPETHLWIVKKPEPRNGEE